MTRGQLNANVAKENDGNAEWRIIESYARDQGLNPYSFILTPRPLWKREVNGVGVGALIP